MPPQGVAVVAVARQDVAGGLDLVEQLGYLFVLRIGRVLGEISRDQQRVGAWPQPANRRDRGAQAGDGVAVPPGSAEVRIAQLDDDEGTSHAV